MEKENIGIVPAELGKDMVVTVGFRKAVNKHDLRLGNMFKEGVVCKVNGRTGAKIHLYGKLFYKKGEMKSISVLNCSDLTPIELNEDVLVNWCGIVNEELMAGSGIKILLNRFEFSDGSRMKYLICKEDRQCLIGWVDYLHELQNFYYALNKVELEIKG